jgi:hydroxyisourate hydrolase
MAQLSTHVLDIAHGRPAAGMLVELWKDGERLVSFATDADGRGGGPPLEGAALVAGTYELQFHVAAYFEEAGANCPFLDVVPLRFRVEEGKSYHVPLVCSPWAYSTYRGS